MCAFDPAVMQAFAAILLAVAAVITAVKKK
jgi:hypothetical protein